MTTWNRTYVNSVTTPYSAPAGARGVAGYYWHDAASWTTNSIPASASTTAVTIQNALETTQQQRIYLLNSTAITNVGSIDIQRGAGTNTVEYLLTSLDKQTVSGVERVRNQRIQFQSAVGLPAITVGAGATLITQPVYRDTTTYSTAHYDSAPSGEANASLGILLAASQKLEKRGLGTWEFTNSSSTFVQSAGSLLTGGVSVVEGALVGESNFMPGSLEVLSAGRIRRRRSGKTLSPTSASIPTGSGLYEVEFAPAMATQPSGQQISIPSLTSGFSGSGFTGTLSIVCGSVNQKDNAAGPAGSSLHLGEDGGHVYVRTNTSATAHHTLQTVLTGVGVYEYIGINGQAALRFGSDLSSFGGTLQIMRATVELSEADNSRLQYTGPAVGAYAGKLLGVIHANSYNVTPANKVWSGWPAGSFAAITNGYTNFWPHFRKKMVLGNSIVSISGNGTVKPGRTLLFPSVLRPQLNENYYPSGRIEAAYQGVFFGGSGAVTFDGALVGVKNIVVPAGRTVTLTSTDAQPVIATSSEADAAVTFGGGTLSTAGSATTGALALDGEVLDCSWTLRNGLTLTFSENAQSAILNVSFAKLVPAVEEGIVEFHTERAWGRSLVGRTSQPIYFSAKHANSSQTSRFRFIGTAADCVLASHAIYLGVGGTRIESSGTKALKITTLTDPTSGGVAFNTPSGATWPTSGTRLFLGGSSTADNTLENFITFSVASKRRTPSSTATLGATPITKVDDGTWTLKGDCPIVGDVTVQRGRLRLDSPAGSSVCSTSLAPNTVIVQTGGTLQPLTGTTQKGRHVYEGNLKLSGGVLHIGG